MDRDASADRPSNTGSVLMDSQRSVPPSPLTMIWFRRGLPRFRVVMDGCSPTGQALPSGRRLVQPPTCEEDGTRLFSKLPKISRAILFQKRMLPSAFWMITPTGAFSRRKEAVSFSFSSGSGQAPLPLPASRSATRLRSRATSSCSSRIDFVS
jgi:hypothetical protein